MDFRTYITAVEKQLSQMTEVQKTDWIYAQARIIEEGRREEFLELLSGQKKTYTELTPDEIFAWCQQIDEGKIYFETEEYECYEEEDWEPDWRIEYHDIFGIIPYLVKAINTCYQLLMQKEYDTTFQLLDRIWRLGFHTDREDDDWFCYEEDLTIERLAEEGLIVIDFTKMSLSLLYACYQIHTGQDRIEKLYGYLMWKQCSTVVLTDVFAYGPEQIEDEADFMKKWRNFLMDTPGDRASELLVDACIYLGGDEQLLKTAEENVEIHPYLYQACCERKLQCQDYAACVAIAEGAVKQIDDNKVIRADISDIAIRSAKKAGDEKQIGYFYQVAFYSNPNSWHLLRLYKLGDHIVIEEALKRVRDLRRISFSGSTDPVEKKETSIYDDDQKTLYRFLLGDYRDILKKCQQNNTYLGWSHDIKGTIIQLLLLYLKKDEEKKTCAERNLIEQIKHSIQYKSIEDEPFDEYLTIWRKSVVIPEAEKEKYVQWLRKEVDKRTESVVGGGYRKSYYKAAELIVVLGAILEERGEINGMQNLIDHYKKQHSRKRAFRSEIDELAEKQVGGE